MTRTKKLLWLSGLLVLAVMAMAFRFSAQDATDSTKVSSGILSQILQLSPTLRQMDPDSDTFLLWESILRKAGHFCEYTLLGLLLSWHISLTSRRRIGLLTVSIGAAYAATDELHQLFSDGRSASVWDVLLDSSGVLTGFLIFLLIRHIIMKHRLKISE